MREFLKTQYEFSDFQIEQLKYTWKMLASEFSKLIIMGILFHNILGIYAFAVVIMLLLRFSTGGLHCNTYLSCFLVSFAYMFLALAVLPVIPASPSRTTTPTLASLVPVEVR